MDGAETRNPGTEATLTEVNQRLRGILAGDGRDTAWLYDTFATNLFRRLRQRYAYAGGPEAEDLLQDAFIFYLQRGARVLGNFLERTPLEKQTRSNLERYLWDLACGVASNRRRSASLRKMVAVEEVRGTSPDPGAEQQAIDRDTLKRLDECLGQRGDRVYLYYKLRYWDGLSPDQIAQATGWSKKATYKLKQALNVAVGKCSELLRLDNG